MRYFIKGKIDSPEMAVWASIVKDYIISPSLTPIKAFMLAPCVEICKVKWGIYSKSSEEVNTLQGLTVSRNKLYIFNAMNLFDQKRI